MLSVIYGLKDYLHSQGFTTETEFISSGFPYIGVKAKDQAYGDLEPPVIVVYPSSVYDNELQIGGGYWIRTVVNFDIYATSEAQLFEIVDLVRQFVERKTYVYRYDQAIPSYQVSDGIIRPLYTGVAPAAICDLQFENRVVTFMDRMGTVGEADAHSAQITTVAVTSTM